MRSPLPRLRRSTVPAILVSGVGAFLLALGCWYLLSVHVEMMLAESDPARLALELAEVGFLLVPPLLLLSLGHRISTRDLPRRQQWAVAQWCLIGAVSVIGVITALTVHHVLFGYAIHASLTVLELLAGAGVGGLLGLAIGWGRASREVHASAVKEQRDAFLFLNRLLRHHVLNGVQVIDGYAARLDGRDDPDVRRVREIVHTRSQSITALVQNVRTVVRTFSGDAPTEPVNLAEVVAAEIDRTRRVFDAVEVDADLPEAVYVESNDLLPVVIENVVDNTVRHNDRDTPRVCVTVEVDDRIVRTRVADNGPGIPESERDRLLEPGETGDRGFGLFLVNRIVTEQGGRLLIEDNEPRGTVVTIELPRAASGDDAPDAATGRDGRA